MRLEIVNPLVEPDWNKLVLRYPAATIFHSAEWASVLEEAYGYRPQYALFRDRDEVVGIVPIMEVRSLWTGRRGVCLPFSDECPPLLGDGVTVEVLLPPIREFGLNHRWDYLELRGAKGLMSAMQTDQYLTHELALDAKEETQLRKLRDSTRRNIQKAEREGVEIQHLQSLDSTHIFYSLHCRTRRRHGLPPQPLRFFHLIHKYIIAPGAGFISLARFKGNWIAGSVFLRFGSHAVYKFGASDPRFQHLRANNLLMWQSICHLRKTNVSRLSLGRSERNDEGLLQFKRGWGGEEVNLIYHRIGLLRETDKNSIRSSNGEGLPHKIIRRLPIPVLRLMGGVMYRHVG